MLLLYLYEPYFCKTVKQVEGGGVVKSVGFKSISPWFNPTWFNPTWFKAHCDHFLKIFLVFEV